MLTKRGFMLAFGGEIQAQYGQGWAADTQKFLKFMNSAGNTIGMPGCTGTNKANLLDSRCARAAWRKSGGEGNMTLKKLRELPLE